MRYRHTAGSFIKSEFVFVCPHPLNGRYQRRTKWNLNALNLNVPSQTVYWATANKSHCVFLPFRSNFKNKHYYVKTKQWAYIYASRMPKTPTVFVKVCISSHLCFICDMLNISTSIDISSRFWSTLSVLCICTKRHAHANTSCIHTSYCIRVMAWEWLRRIGWDENGNEKSLKSNQTHWMRMTFQCSINWTDHANALARVSAAYGFHSKYWASFELNKLITIYPIASSEHNRLQLHFHRQRLNFPFKMLKHGIFIWILNPNALTVQMNPDEAYDIHLAFGVELWLRAEKFKSQKLSGTNKNRTGSVTQPSRYLINYSGNEFGNFLFFFVFVQTWTLCSVQNRIRIKGSISLPFK